MPLFHRPNSDQILKKFVSCWKMRDIFVTVLTNRRRHVTVLTYRNCALWGFLNFFMLAFLLEKLKRQKRWHNAVYVWFLIVYLTVLHCLVFAFVFVCVEKLLKRGCFGLKIDIPLPLFSILYTWEVLGLFVLNLSSLRSCYLFI